LKAVHHTLLSSAEIGRAFNADFDTVNLHHPTSGKDAIAICKATRSSTCKWSHAVAAPAEIESNS
jgi:hypothetical protein